MIKRDRGWCFVNVISDHRAEWVLFWGMSLSRCRASLYFRQMVRSSSSTRSLLHSYVRGTIDGMSATDPLLLKN